MYSYERDSRLHMKKSYETTSRSPSRGTIERIETPTGSQQRIQSSNDRLNQSSRTHNRTVLHERLPNNGQYHHVNDTTHQTASHELDHLDSGDVKYHTKTQMAQASQESQELYRSSQDRGGLKTVKTRRIVKKTTTITRGENEKLEEPVDDKAELREELRKHLECIKKELNILENRIDNMAPVGDNMHTLRKQLIEMEDFERRLSKVRNNLDEVIDIGGDFLRNDEQLRYQLKDCQEQLARIESKASKRLRDIDAAMNRVDAADAAMTRFNIKMDAMKKELNDLEHRLDSMAPVGKDLKTLQRQLSEMEDFDRRIAVAHGHLEEIVQLANDMIRQDLVKNPNVLLEQIADCRAQLERIEERAAKRAREIADALNKCDASEAAMAKFNVRLDAIRRELDDLEHRLNSMAPVARDAATLREQLNEMEDFNRRVEKCRNNLQSVIDFGEELIAKDLVPNPRLLRDQLHDCQEQLKRIEARAAKRMRDIMDALGRADAAEAAMRKFQLKLDAIKKELDDLERRLDGMAPVGKDMDTLRAQLAEMKDFEQRLNKCRRNLEDLNDFGEDLIMQGLIENPRLLREQIRECQSQLARLEARAAKRLRDIQDAMNQAEAREAAMRKFQLKLDAIQKELDDLERRIDGMAPVGKDMDTLRAQLAEMRDFEQRLNKCRRNLEDLADFGEDLIRQDLIEDPRLLRDQVKECQAQLARIEAKAAKRLRAIQDAMNRSELAEAAMQKFRLKLEQINKELDDLERQAANWLAPGRDLPTLKRQLQELQEFKQRLGKVARMIEDITELAEDMIRQNLLDDPHELRHEVKQCQSRLAHLDELAKRREQELEWALSKVGDFNNLADDLRQFIDRAQSKLDRLTPVGGDLDTVKRQVEELKQLKKEVEPRGVDVERLNRLGQELMANTTAEQARPIRDTLNDINKRWNALIKGLNQRQNNLEQALLRIGQFELAIQDLLDWMSQCDRALDKVRVIRGDAELIEAEMAKLRVILKDIEAHAGSVESINRAGKKLIEEQQGSYQALESVRRKLDELNNCWQKLQAKAQKKRQDLEESLKEARAYERELQDLFGWFNEIEQALNSPKPVGGLPDTAREQLDKFMELYHEVETNRARVESILAKGDDLIRRATEGCCNQLKNNVKVLKQRWQSILQRCSERKSKLEGALRDAEALQSSLQQFVDWLSSAEKHINSLEPVSRVLERVSKQMEEHKEFQRQVNSHADELVALEKRANQLRQVCTKHDATIIKNVMTSVSNRWQRLVAKTSERTRALEQGYKEAKQFADAWNDIMRWLDTAQANLNTSDIDTDNPDEIRQLIAKHKEYQRALESKQSTYEAVMRMGRQLKEKAPRVDHSVIQDMLDELRDKWNKVWNAAADRQRRLDEALQDALNNMRMKRPPVTEQEIIEDEVQRQVAKCTCLHRYKVYHVGEGRYRFGESQKLRLVRILRSVVMVRVGGGWVSLEEFLQKNDPCRAKGRTNVELREQFILPDGASQALASFKSKMARDPSSVSPVGPVMKIREKTDKSMPMTGARQGTPSDYYSEEDAAGLGERARSRNHTISPAW